MLLSKKKLTKTQQPITRPASQRRRNSRQVYEQKV